MQYEMPLAEVVLDFFDRLKSVSRGYASFDYEFEPFPGGAAGQARHPDQRRQGRRAVDHRHRDSAYQRGRELVDKMQELIPRQMFEVAIQAAIGAHVIARATVKALRKNVLAKCYGGDVIAQAQAAREAERGQEAHEAARPGRDSAGSVSRGAAGRPQGMIRLRSRINVMQDIDAAREMTNTAPRSRGDAWSSTFRSSSSWQRSSTGLVWAADALVSSGRCACSARARWRQPRPPNR